MTETRATYYPVDPEQLLPDQVRILRRVLSVFSLHQLLLLAVRVWQVCDGPGFGRVVITVENHHPARVEAGASEALLPSLDAETIEKLEKLMEVENDDQN